MKKAPVKKEAVKKPVAKEETKPAPKAAAATTEPGEAEEQRTKWVGKPLTFATTEDAEDWLIERREKAHMNKDMDKLRAPVVCVLGHVDTGSDSQCCVGR